MRSPTRIGARLTVSMSPKRRSTLGWSPGSVSGLRHFMAVSTGLALVLTRSYRWVALLLWTVLAPATLAGQVRMPASCDPVVTPESPTISRFPRERDALHLALTLDSTLAAGSFDSSVTLAWAADSALAEEALAEIVADDELFSWGNARAAAASYRDLSGASGPLLRRVGYTTGSEKLGLVLGAISGPVPQRDQATILGYACDAMWFLSTASHDGWWKRRALQESSLDWPDRSRSMLEEAARLLDPANAAVITRFLEALPPVRTLPVRH